VVFSLHGMEETILSSREKRTAEGLIMLSGGDCLLQEKRRKVVDHVSEEELKFLCNSRKGDRGKFMCVVCHQVFKLRSRCELYEKKHEKLKFFTCHFCGRCYSTKSCRDAHEFVHER